MKTTSSPLRSFILCHSRIQSLIGCRKFTEKFIFFNSSENGPLSLTSLKSLSLGSPPDLSQNRDPYHQLIYACANKMTSRSLFNALLEISISILNYIVLYYVL
ncbi:hypothetical protein CHARACLAT_033142 [Characodon lateralis]|uniref:Uncharacterized protein n=1 Tax=Characodon lateralis TaxID=208331 RepID=A0ABU7E094_9TELE|nr:hypothetical protein [Characodon lateralis]